MKVIRYECLLKLTKEERDVLFDMNSIYHYITSKFDLTEESCIGQEVYDKIIKGIRQELIELE